VVHRYIKRKLNAALLNNSVGEINFQVCSTSLTLDYDKRNQRNAMDTRPVATIQACCGKVIETGKKGGSGGIDISLTGGGAKGAGEVAREIHVEKHDCGDSKCRTSTKFDGPKSERENFAETLLPSKESKK
jgi:hypothetical protein